MRLNTRIINSFISGTLFPGPAAFSPERRFPLLEDRLRQFSGGRLQFFEQRTVALEAPNL